MPLSPDLTRFAMVILISYLAWKTSCVRDQSGAWASCPSLSASKHPCSSNTCQDVLSESASHVRGKKFNVGEMLFNLFFSIFFSFFFLHCIKVNSHSGLQVHVRPFAVPMWAQFVSVCLLSRVLRHCAICIQAGSQEAHTGAHMAGHRSPTQSQPTQSHAYMCTGLHSSWKCIISIVLFHRIYLRNWQEKSK